MFFLCTQEYVSCSGSVEQCSFLASSLLSLESWLFTIIGEALSKMCDSNVNANDCLAIVNISASILEMMTADEYLISMKYIGLCGFSQVYDHLIQLCGQAESRLNNWIANDHSAGNLNLVDRLKNIMTRCLNFEADLFEDKNVRTAPYDDSLCTDVHTLVSWEALLRPTSDGQVLAQKLDILQKLRGYSPTQLYCEILRACCLGLAETSASSASSNTDELLWAVFTFLKTPSLLLRLHRAIHGKREINGEGSGVGGKDTKSLTRH